MCQHDFTKESDTLKILPIVRMVTPQQYILQCTECGEVFTVLATDIPNIKTFVGTHTL